MGNHDKSSHNAIRLLEMALTADRERAKSFAMVLEMFSVACVLAFAPAAPAVAQPVSSQQGTQPVQPVQPVQQPAPVVVAVVPFLSRSVTDDVVVAVGQAVADAVDAIEGHLALRRDAIANALGGPAAGEKALAMCADIDCVANLVRLLGSSKVLAFSIRKTVDAFLLRLIARPLALAAAAPVSRAAPLAARAPDAVSGPAVEFVFEWDGNPLSLATIVPPAVRHVLLGDTAPVRYGQLELRTNVEGAAVSIDGKRIGTTPMGIVSMSEGTHALRLEHPKFYPHDQPFLIAFGVLTSLDAPLIAIPPPPRPIYMKWPFWAAVTGGTAVLGVASYFIFRPTTGHVVISGRAP